MDEFSRLQAEVDALRAEIRRGRRWVAIAAMAAVGIALAGAKGSPSVVRAQQFELVDDHGEIRGTWTTIGNAPILRM